MTRHGVHVSVYMAELFANYQWRSNLPATADLLHEALSFVILGSSPRMTVETFARRGQKSNHTRISHMHSFNPRGKRG